MFSHAPERCTCNLAIITSTSPISAITSIEFYQDEFAQ
jgi:hypothetical protein